jgi:hypothetical protein
MSTTIYEPTMEKENVIPHNEDTEQSARSIFTYETGQVLVALGTLFKHIPPFNESIDQSTGDTLISIGRKLKSTK